ncbi:MAG: hypothetical protein ACREF5_01610 [Candidatus Saccharimonadales bacterium]
MLADNRQILRRLVIIGVLFISLLICITIYSLRGNDFALTQTAPSFRPIVTNPAILQNWLPQISYRYTIASIDDYLHTKNLKVSNLSILGKVTINESRLGSYDFSLLFEPQNQSHRIVVTINNFSGTISTGVAIDGIQQNYAASSQTNSNTKYSGINDLVSLGVTSIQAGELQSAFQNFFNKATNVTINTGSIDLPPVSAGNTSLINVYTFSVNINNINYKAKLDCINLSQIDLLLTKSNRQVFDSGVISQS